MKHMLEASENDSAVRAMGDERSKDECSTCAW